MVLTISEQAIVSAGVNYTICEGTTYTLNTANAAKYSSLLWISSGTGSFNNAATLNPVYTPSMNDLDDGSFASLTLTAYSDDPCVDVTSTMMLFFSAVRQL